MLPMSRSRGILQLNSFGDEKSAPSKHFSIKENEKSLVDEVVLEADEDRIACTEVKVSGKEHEVLLYDSGEGDPNICLMDLEEIAVQYQDSVDGQHFLHAGKALEDQSTNQGDCRKEFTKEKLQVLLEADEARIACTDVMISDKEHEVLLSDFGDVYPNICLDTEEIAVRYQDSVDGQIFLHAGKALEDQSTNQGDCWKEFTKEKEADEVLLEADEAQIACSEVMVSGKEHKVMLSDFGDGDRNICSMDTEEIAVRYQDSVDHQHFLHAGKALEDQSTNQDSVVSQHFLHAGNALEDQSTNQGDCWKVFTEDKFEKDCSLCTPDSSKTLHHDAYLNNYSESIREFEVFRFGIPTMIEGETNHYSDLSCLKEQIVSLLDKLRKCERDVNSGSRNELTGGEKMESGEKRRCATPVSESRESTDAEPFREMSSKPELPRKDIQRTGSQNCTGFKNNENAPRNSSFVPLIRQRQQATTPVTGRREIRVKALKAAEAAKCLEEKKQKEREMRKAAFKLEKERLKEENIKKMYRIQKAKEEASKKKGTEFAARHRQIEEEMKNKESKRRCIEVQKEQRDRGHARKEKKEIQCSVSAVPNSYVPQKSIQDCMSVTKESASLPSYEISPYRDSGEEDGEEDVRRERKYIPLWARKENLDQILRSNSRMDPEVIFSHKSSFNLSEVLSC